MKEKLSRWMYGRYGMDDLSKTLVYVSLGLWIVTILFDSMIADVFAMVCLVYAYFRIFSKNHSKRYAELTRFEAWKNRMRRLPEQMAVRRTYHIYKCPECKQKMRVPRGRGRIEVSCPRCRAKFIKRS